MATGLALCALANFAFGFGVDVSEWITGESSGSQFNNTLILFMGVMWVVNGMLQGTGFPPCARLLTHWIPPTELATKMSVWNTSHSIGAGLVVILCGYIMSHMGTGDAHVGAWRWCFWIPAGISFAGAIGLFISLRDTPTSVGLPELPGTESKKSGDAPSAADKAFLRRKVFGNPLIWILAFANFFVYIVRFSVLDWGPTLLSQSKGVSMSHAGWLVAMFEIAGIVGMLVAGWATDNPAPDSPEHLEAELALIRRDAVVRVLPYGSITRGQKGRGELVDFGALAGEVVGFSDDGRGVQGEELMAEAMRRAAAVGKPIVAHCEVDELLKGGYIHDGVYCREHGHKGICSESEWRQVERDIKLAAETGCQYHVCHVSTKESVELIRRAKAAGLKVSGETAPHYLLLCDEDLQEDGRFKMNPPLRGREDREALRQAVADGTIEVIATDHAPHTAEQKSRGLAGSAMGIVGLECAFPLLYTYLVKPGLLTLEQLVERMSMAPRRIFGLGGGLQAGEPADLTVFDLDAEYEIDPETFLSKGRATPFAGWRVAGRTLWTLVGGRTAYATERFR